MSREHFRATMAYLRQHGATDVRLEANHRRPRVVFHYGGRQHFVTQSRAPVDHHDAIKTALQRIRRLTGIPAKEHRL